MSIYTAKDFSHLLGLTGFSDGMLNNHFALYQGYVKNVDTLVEKLEASDQNSVEAAELERRFGWEFNGMRMHELYFGNMAKGGVALSDRRLKQKIVSIYGSYEKWLECFKAKGMMRGIGWVILFLDTTNGELFTAWIREHEQGIPVNCKVLLVMDCWEHAYMTDYGIKKADYINSFIQSIDWHAVEERI